MAADDQRLTVLEVKFDALDKSVQSDRQLLHKVIYSLLGLIAVLVGKESVESALHNTPAAQHIQFALTVYAFSGLALYLISRSLLREESSVLRMIAGLLFLTTAFLRVDVGFAVSDSLSGISYTVPFALGSLILLLEAARTWIRQR